MAFANLHHLWRRQDIILSIKGQVYCTAVRSVLLYISLNGLVSDEISARIRKARLSFVNLRHLWRKRDIRLSTKGQVYCAAVNSVLLCDCETRSLRTEVT
ncbi:unnamed protein product [Schistosoma margrebowiei]|uniref:Uncharacterized protein n=1 Tax=Schistosoma margrebowiei TaxID=48269 RepID=A0A3P8BNS7_9TREM|nr:unnamed protein product [Schistosoma margrebowiei]